MGERPAGLTIDRIEGDRGYEPGNCRWATGETQNTNRRTVIMVGEVNARTYAKLAGVRYTSFLAAMRRGLSAEDAVAHLKRHGRPLHHPNSAT